MHVPALPPYVQFIQDLLAALAIPLVKLLRNAAVAPLAGISMNGVPLLAAVGATMASRVSFVLHADWSELGCSY